MASETTTAGSAVTEASLAATGETPTGVQHQVGEAGAGKNDLQEVLPEIKDLAQRVGGMDRLAEIVNTLRQSKEP